MKLLDIMNTNFKTLSPEDTILKTIHYFRNSKTESLPVMDNGKLMGIITRANIFDALLSGHKISENIKDIIRKNILKLRADYPYTEIKKIIEENKMVGGSVVVDADDNVIGLFNKAEMITASLKYEQFLNAQLRAIYDTIDSGLILIDKNGLISLVNSTAENVFDLQSEKVLGQLINEIIPNPDILKEFQANSEGFRGNYLINGKQAIVTIRMISIKKVMGFIVILHEMIELEKIASELESVKRLNNILETILDIGYDGLGVINEQGIITLANQSFADFYHLNKKEIIGSNINKLIKDSKLFNVAKTGIAEINQVDFIGNTPCIVSRLPLVQSGKVIGAIEKIVYSQLEQLKGIAQRLETMDNKLSYYETKLKKHKNYKSFFSFEDIISINPLMDKLKQEAQQISRGKSTVLIIGESGTGKELFAQGIHLASTRSKKPFISVNCAAIPENLLESDFFGYAPGAFTGASKNGKPGYLELADSGTLFLDEIGDMPLSLQAKLLRVLQDSKFQRVGGTETIGVDVRVVAATNQNLEEKVKNGSFRGDLYYRINVITLQIIPLRERKEDVIPLAYSFLRKHTTNENLEISNEVKACLERHNWPGNVRELENVIERAINFITNNQIEIQHLPNQLVNEVYKNKSDLQLSSSEDKDLSTYSNLTAKELIIDALKKVKGNKSKAAKLLGISRAWLYIQLKNLDIN